MSFHLVWKDFKRTGNSKWEPLEAVSTERSMKVFNFELPGSIGICQNPLEAVPLTLQVYVVHREVLVYTNAHFAFLPSHDRNHRHTLISQFCDSLYDSIVLHVL